MPRQPGTSTDAMNNQASFSLRQLLLGTAVFAVVLGAMLAWRGEAPGLCLFVAVSATATVMVLNRKNFGGAAATLIGALAGACWPLTGSYFPPEYQQGPAILGAIVGGVLGSCLWRVTSYFRRAQTELMREARRAAAAGEEPRIARHGSDGSTAERRV